MGDSRLRLDGMEGGRGVCVPEWCGCGCGCGRSGREMGERHVIDNRKRETCHQ